MQFKSKTIREDPQLLKIQQEVELQQEAEKMVEEEQAEKRNAGGAETVVDYQRARVTGENKAAFGSTLDREKYSTQSLFQSRDKSVPGPGMYIYQQQSTKLPPKLNTYEGRDGAIPTVLNDQIGPGAEKAL